MKRFLKPALFLSLLFLFIWLALGLFGSWVSTQARLVDIPAAENYFDTYPAKEILLQAKDGQKIVAWYLPNDTASTVVILLAGIGGNRVGMVDRAKIYLSQGFGVLVPDLRGTGESSGGRITFGWEERLDLLAAVDFLQDQKIKNIAVHGCSLGAATISYTLPEAPLYQFVVMEAPYDNIEQALENRVALFHLPLFLFRPLIWWTEWRLGVNTNQLAPENYMALYSGPIFLLAGDSELKVKKEETEKIFQKMTSKNKQLYFFKGAKHEDYLKRDAQTYQSVLVKWIEKFSPKPKSTSVEFNPAVQ